MKYHVKPIALGVATGCLGLAMVAWTHSGIGLTFDGSGAGCRSFWGETIQSVAWSRGGRFLAVLATTSDYRGRMRVFGWPGMGLLSQAETHLGAVDTIPIEDDGAIFDQIPDGRYFNFLWAADAPAATERTIGPPELFRLVRLASGQPPSEPTALTSWMDGASDFWIDRTGQWITWTQDAGPGGPGGVVVSHGGKDRRLPLPGYGGRTPTLTPAHDAVIYQRSETARLTVLDLATGQLRGELDAREFYGGEVSSTGILAAPTAHGPSQGNELCVIDVAARLSALAAAPDRPLPPVVTPP
jgi:hypothetical protein